MLNLSTRYRISLAFGLFLLMAVTRGHHSFTLAKPSAMKDAG